MNVGMLKNRCVIMKEVDNTTEFGNDDPVPVLANIPCDLDTLAAGGPMPVGTPGTQVNRAQAIISIVDPRLGRDPNRLFDTTNWLVINGKPWEIAQIHEVQNKMTGEMDHFEILAFEGVNR